MDQRESKGSEMSYPPDTRTGPSRPEALIQECPDGHEWEALVYWELGRWYFVDEDAGPVCPKCKKESEDENSRVDQE